MPCSLSLVVSFSLFFRCINGGTCIDGIDNFVCSCPPNITGVLCECLILEDNKLDCTYNSHFSIDVSTTVSFYNYSNKGNDFSTAIISTITLPTPFEIPKVPTMTFTTDFLNETAATIITSTDAEVSVSHINSFNTEFPTVFFTNTTTAAELNITSSENMSHAVSFVDTTEYIIVTTTRPASTAMTIYSAETTKVFTTTTIEKTSTETTFSPISLEIITTLFQNQTVSIGESTTKTVELNSPINNTTILSSTASTETTIVGDTTAFIMATDEKEATTMLPDDEITMFPSVTSFFSIKPTGEMVASNYTSTDSVTFETTTHMSIERMTTLTTVDCTKVDSRCQNGGTCVFSDQGYKVKI